MLVYIVVKFSVRPKIVVFVVIFAAFTEGWFFTESLCLIKPNVTSIFKRMSSTKIILEYKIFCYW